ncbi:MAG: hypothetical protein WDM78_22865 [Puia sp.]
MSPAISPWNMLVQAPDLKSLESVIPKLMGEVYKSGKLVFQNPDFKIDRPEIGISIDRQRAAQLGISTQEIGTHFATRFEWQTLRIFYL